MNLNALCAFDIMPYLVDIIVAAFIVVFTLLCAKKGFINCLFGFVSSILALVLAFSFATLTADITGGLFGLQDTMETSLIATFSELNGFNVVLDQNADLTELLQTQDMSNIVANLIAQNWIDTPIPEGYTLGMMAGETVAEFATALISGVALFIVLRIVFAILKKFFNFIARDGLLGGLNKLLGAAIGLIESILIVSVLVAVLAMFPNMMSFLNGSIILTALYNANPLLWIISLFL